MVQEELHQSEAEINYYHAKTIIDSNYSLYVRVGGPIVTCVTVCMMLLFKQIRAHTAFSTGNWSELCYDLCKKSVTSKSNVLCVTKFISNSYM